MSQQTMAIVSKKNVFDYELQYQQTVQLQQAGSRAGSRIDGNSQHEGGDEAEERAGIIGFVNGTDVH
jgi:hypothetical protein